MRYVYPEWYTRDIIDIKLKAILHKKFKTCGSIVDYKAFAQYRTIVKNKIKLAHERYRNRIQSNILSEPKSLWNYVKSKRGSRCTRQIVLNGEALSGDRAAEEFANYFYSVYSSGKPELNVHKAIMDEGGESGAARVHIGRLEARDVRQALERLKPKKSSGPDGIPPYIFRDCRMVLAEPLLHIFNLCLESAVFPEVWQSHTGTQGKPRN